MELRKAVLIAVAAALAAGTGVREGWAEPMLSGRASTVFEWFDTADEKTATPIYQYLQLNATDLAGKGWNARLYGRLADDLSDEADVDSRFYYGYLEKRNLFTDFDVRLGRQFIATTAGASLLDGANLTYRNLGPVDIVVFGGGDVAYYDEYDSDELVWGAEVSADGLVENLDVALSYLQKWGDDHLTYELIGLDVDYDIPNLIQFYNETQYSWITEEVTYFVLGTKYYRSETWSLRAEYLYSLPVFSSTSIYSVFAADEYQEAMLELNYRIARGLNAFGRYSREFYQSGIDDANVFEAGVEKIRTARFSGYLTGTYRMDDDGQDLKGVKARAAWLVFPRLEAGVGAHVDVLERQIGFLGDQYDDKDDTTSARYWGDLRSTLTDNIDVEGKLEYVHSSLWDDYYRGRVRLNVRF